MQALQRAAGNRATSRLVQAPLPPPPTGTRLVQRNAESAEQLEGMAKPKVVTFPAEEIAVQKDIVTRLEAAIAGRHRAQSGQEAVVAELEAANEELASGSWSWWANCSGGTTTRR